MYSLSEIRSFTRVSTRHILQRWYKLTLSPSSTIVRAQHRQQDASARPLPSPGVSRCRQPGHARLVAADGGCHRADVCFVSAECQEDARERQERLCLNPTGLTGRLPGRWRFYYPQLALGDCLASMPAPALGFMNTDGHDHNSLVLPLMTFSQPLLKFTRALVDGIGWALIEKSPPIF